MGDELMQTMQEVDAAPRLIIEVMTSSLSGRRFAFTATDLRHGVLLGRASDCHVRFDPGKDLKVSGHHCLIDEREGRITVRDQGSSNGVFLNDVRVTASGAAVLSGSKLSLGQEGAIMKLLIAGQPAAPSPKAATAPQASAPPPASPAAPAAASPPPPVASPPRQAQSAPPEFAGRGMPSVQADPGPRRGEVSSIDRVVEQVGTKVGAGEKTKYLLKEVAEQLEARQQKKSGALVTIVGALFLLLLAAGATVGWYMLNEQDKDKRDKAERDTHDRAQERELEAMRREVDAIKASNEAVAKMAADMDTFRREQERQMEEVAKRYGGSSEGQDALLKRLKEVEEKYQKDREDLEKRYEEEKKKREEETRAALAGSGRELSSEQAFRAIADRYDASVFMVFVQFPLLDKDGKRVSIQEGSGTGWLARTSDNRAWVITNKHVIMPYLFKADLAISYALQDLHPDPDFSNWVIACWPSGSKLRAAVGSNQLDVSEAWASIPGKKRGGRGSLAVKGFADDEFAPKVPAAELLTTYGFKADLPDDVLKRIGEIRVHKMDTANDLCVIELDRPDRKFLATPLEIATDAELDKLHKLDPVMALGYPLGLSVIKSATTTTSPATGVIRSLQRDASAIGISVPIMPGNSGGPLIDRNGKVIGVTTRGFEATLAEAIYVDHARRLLDKLAR
ncbi:MAG: hypothetical protein HPKKFMNG_02125 [Planctomycetes bacterium]|nr:hypothetical protein [Planctomycetota bacterium]